MQNNSGYTLVELLLVITVIGILSTISMLGFQSYTKKAAIEAEIKMLHSDLMTVRAEAFYQKKSRAVVVSTNQLSIYASDDTSVAPTMTRALQYPVVSDKSGPIVIDSAGVLNLPGSGGRCLCIDAGDNGSVVDSIVLSETRIRLGKWDPPGGAASECNAGKIKKL